MKRALEVAQYFLHRVDRDEGDTISGLRLQKLVYYTQVWSMVLRNEPFFSESIEAWVHGPVVREVWQVYKDYGKRDIPAPDSPPPTFAADDDDLLNCVWQRYGDLSATQLRDLTHCEQPWLEARRGLSDQDPSSQTISLASMREFHRTESPWGRLTEHEQPILKAIAGEILQQPEKFVLELQPRLHQIVTLVLDAMERQNSNYTEVMATAVNEALESFSNRPALNADEFADWIAEL